jgi:hypothetical protein
MGSQFDQERNNISISTIRSGVDNHPEQIVLRSLTNITKKGGVISDSDLIVVEPAGGGLNVDIGVGSCICLGTNAYPVYNSATYTQEIDANASGNPRVTSVVVYIDLSASPATDGEGYDVAKFKTVNGSAGGYPVIPSDSEIQSSVGASNPFVRLANVYVASGATGISNANITNTYDRAFIQSFAPIKVVDSPSSPYAINCNISNKWKFNLSGSLTLSHPTNMNVGDIIKIEFTSPSYAYTWFSGITWLSPDVTQSTSGATTYAIEKLTATTYNGYLVGKKY